MKYLAIVLPLVLAVFLISIPAVDGQTNYKIPSWIKNLAKFWVNDKISDQQFGVSLSYLIDKGMIKVPLVDSLKQENEKLKNENSQLRVDLAKEEVSEPKDEKPSTLPLIPKAKVPIQKLIAVTVDKPSYQIGETIYIRGEVGEMLASKNVQLTIKDSEGNEVLSKVILVDDDRKFLLIISDSENYFSKPGMYSLRAKYETEDRTTTVTFEIKK